MPHTIIPQEILRAGRTLEKQGKVGAVLFSEGTYQVEVKGQGKEVYWPFLQMDDQGGLKDHFCTCEQGDAGGWCPHQAAAWLKIFRGLETPLHVRFRHSLWNGLCQMGARRHGYETTCLKGSATTQFQAFSTTKKRLFAIKALNAKGRHFLKETIVAHKVETEETSLKFSSLEPEELALWREGRPSHSLSYELSFWSDLAKGWMVLQEEGEKYQIRFHAEPEELPKEITVVFPQFEATFYIAEANWPLLIPSLATVSSPLKTHEFSHEQIKKIFYHPLKKQFNLDIDITEPKAEEVAYPVGEWNFVAGKGFFPAKVDPLLKEKVISASQIGEFLHRHQHLVSTHLIGTKIHLDPMPARYSLRFDDESALHLICYLFEEGDLQTPQAARYGSWVFIPEKGFYHLEDLLFDELEKIIPQEEVASFVTRHRHWLHAFEGFQTHVIAIESQLTYTLSDKGLCFDVGLEVAEEAEKVIDFGEWIYVQERGFYAKSSRPLGQSITAGMVVAKDDIASFIRSHREELEAVTAFFSTQNPVQSASLCIALNEQGLIAISPRFSFLPSFAGKKIEIFEHFTYVEHAGFCAIPDSLRLPDPYFKEVVIDSAAEPYFVAYEINTLEPFILEIDPSLKKPHHLVLNLLSFHREPEGTWLVELEYLSESGSVDALAIWEALGQGKRHLFSSAGLLLLNSPRYNWLKGLSKKRWLKKGRAVRLTTLEWMRLFVFEEIKEPHDDESLANWRAFQSFEPPLPCDLSGLKSSLRGYQELGVKWLWFLYSYGLSGLLCDEMGLGKTHQAMALLAAASNAKKGAKFLVVCPTSVIFHWQDLLRRFLPHIRPLVFYGAHRTLVDFATHFDLLLTSYGTLRSGKSHLAEIPFDIAIYDELQIAKNAASQTHKALKQIEATVRIGLTGTPIENNLLELKALFDVVLPTYMPTETLYKEFFVNPIEKQHDPDKQKLLARFIHPFILRRKKSEVLLELPEKVETIAYAPLSEEQKKLYQEVVAISKEKLIQELQSQDKPLPYMHIFSLLTKLKQICDHPALFLGEPLQYKKHSSGKWDFFVELIQEIQSSGHKVVVFSQYLGMLDIIEAYLTEAGITFAAIRGSTRNRREQVEKFRDDPNCTVFVGSLQAAGVGIDLISASFVIHYDRWWNPAKENQATDRVHRMGQSRGVQVFKMVTPHTIEEHIHQLIEKKLGLTERVVGFDDQGEFKNYSREDLVELLRLMEIDVEKD
jgi:superfamily II DNA or RNA helicase